MSKRARMSRSMSKILAAALLSGGLTAAVLVMAPQLRAQTPAAPAAPPPRPPSPRRRRRRPHPPA